MNTDKNQARLALDQAREAHAAALLAQMDAPADPDAQRRLKDAVRQGRSAWKGYQAAATAGLAQQIDGIIPADFQEGTERPA